MVSKQEKGIPEFANTIRACFVFLIIEECSWKSNYPFNYFIKWSPT